MKFFYVCFLTNVSFVGCKPAINNRSSVLDQSPQTIQMPFISCAGGVQKNALTLIINKELNSNHNVSFTAHGTYEKGETTFTGEISQAETTQSDSGKSLIYRFQVLAGDLKIVGPAGTGTASPTSIEFEPHSEEEVPHTDGVTSIYEAGPEGQNKSAISFDGCGIQNLDLVKNLLKK